MTQAPHDKSSAETPEELRAQVEHTRHELGSTVEALAAKADVKTRAQEKAAEVKVQAADRAGALKEQAAHKAEEVKAKASDATARVQAKMPDQVKGTMEHAQHLWQDKAPRPVQDRAAQGARMAREHRGLLVAVAAFGACVWLMRHGKD
ncbi:MULTISPECIES: DUF3618 domain-containing protein [unclassified Streptomyces]|uniref:DUF3618 domain-containing protein n=1 Tax=unclassified Streptomyces TaxID=2593676 RepID=UPI0007498CC9|nr:MULTISPECIES: DUF3618 domain-containing protein [unclassified Streptomyces]KUL68987.1 hypothetical protein ADL34_31235 [Streptomyces sp. NRRL WC-3605]KUL80290.1 hypothetical protein ADL33_03510 [Streptomyces sp. NRRL WC-3604]